MATTVSLLESLANELFELIVAFLDLESIRNLRLISRIVNHKTVQEHYKSFFRTKHVDTTEESLRGFVRATSEGSRLGCLVEDLTLTGIVYNTLHLERTVEEDEEFILADSDAGEEVQPSTHTSEDLEKAKADFGILKQRKDDSEQMRRQGLDLALLTEAFRNLKKLRPSGLKSLSLEICVLRDDTTTRLLPSKGNCLESCLRMISATFELAMRSICSSGLRVEALDLFRKEPNSLCCGLRCDTLRVLSKLFANKSFVLQGLKTLSLTLADPSVEEGGRDANTGDDLTHEDFPSNSASQDETDSRQLQLDEPQIMTGLQRLLEMCHDLETLDLRWYNLYTRPELNVCRRRIMRRFASDLSSIDPRQKLRRVALGGLTMSCIQLANFVHHHRVSLRELALENIRINDGSLMPLLSYITSEDSGVRTIHLEDIFLHDSILYFVDDQFSRLYGQLSARNDVDRQGDDVKRKIKYYFYEGEPVGRGLGRERYRQRFLKFGGR